MRRPPPPPPPPSPVVVEPADVGAASLVGRSVAGLILLAAILWATARLLPTSDTLVMLGRDWLPPGHLSSLLLFVAAATLLSAVGLPRQSVALVGGYAFGVTLGSAVALIAVTLGSALICEVARTLGRPRLERRLPRLVRRLDVWAGERVFARVLAVRLFPVGSNLLTSAAAGVAHVPRAPFLAASLLGFLPQTLVFGIAGDGVGASSPTALVLAAALLVLSIVAGLGFGRGAARP